MIIDNDFLTKEEVEEIRLSLTDRFDWTIWDSTAVGSNTYQTAQVIYDENTKDMFQFAVGLREHDRVVHNYYDYLMSRTFYKFITKHNIKIDKILRVKCNLVTRSKDNKYQVPHIDQESPHKVFLYYVNDSDGDTVFFNEFYNGVPQKLTVDQKISPEAGKAVVFDGLQYHAPTPPTNSDYRVVINVDFI